MNPMSRLLMILAVLALMSAGCGSDSSSDTETAASSSADTTGAKEKNTVSAEEQRVKFAACMRSNGVPDFPDANEDGEFVFGINVSPAVWQKAVDACKELQPPGSLSAKRTPEQQSVTLRFAACMRENGVKDFPDPANGEPLVDTTRIPSSNRPGGMTILNAAMESCRDLMAQAAAGQ